MAEFINMKFLEKVATKGRLVDAMNLLDELSEADKAFLPKLPELSSWECVLEEVIDTDHEPEYYTRFVNELFYRGYSKHDIQKMRLIAWETAGWLNYEMMVWDWCYLSESDMHKGLEARFKKEDISKEKYEEFNKLIELYKRAPMRNSIALFHFENEDIKIDIVARFDGDNIVIDGYDIGKTVEEAWGDSDYEYAMTIPDRSLPPLYRLLNVKVDDRKALLEALAKRFHGNKCFSIIGDFLDQNSIKHETFTWT